MWAWKVNEKQDIYYKIVRLKKELSFTSILSNGYLTTHPAGTRYPLPHIPRALVTLYHTSRGHSLLSTTHPAGTRYSLPHIPRALVTFYHTSRGHSLLSTIYPLLSTTHPVGTRYSPPHIPRELVGLHHTSRGNVGTRYFPPYSAMHAYILTTSTVVGRFTGFYPSDVEVKISKNKYFS